jgi:hypothetical protein
MSLEPWVIFQFWHNRYRIYIYIYIGIIRPQTNATSHWLQPPHSKITSTWLSLLDSIIHKCDKETYNIDYGSWFMGHPVYCFCLVSIFCLRGNPNSQHMCTWQYRNDSSAQTTNSFPPVCTGLFSPTHLHVTCSYTNTPRNNGIIKLFYCVRSLCCMLWIVAVIRNSQK